MYLCLMEVRGGQSALLGGLPRPLTHSHEARALRLRLRLRSCSGLVYRLRPPTSTLFSPAAHLCFAASVALAATLFLGGTARWPGLAPEGIQRTVGGRPGAEQREELLRQQGEAVGFKASQHRGETPLSVPGLCLECRQTTQKAHRAKGQKQTTTLYGHHFYMAHHQPYHTYHGKVGQRHPDATRTHIPRQSGLAVTVSLTGV